MNNCHISLKNVSLVYDLYFDRSDSLKEKVVNALYRRKYVERKEDHYFALNDVSLEISHGERVGIIGLNGSGKSTLLKVISGVLKPTEGSLEVRGTIQPLIEVGAGFNPEFSGRENIYLNGYMLGFTTKQIRDKEKEIIEFSELGNFIDVPVKYYSSGMSVRLAFTIATMIEPEVLVFDEMLSAGDAEFISKATRRMDRLLTQAKMMVLVSHDLGMVAQQTQRTIVLDKGRMIYSGKTDDAIEYYREMVARNIEKRESQKKEPVKKEEPVKNDVKEDEIEITSSVLKRALTGKYSETVEEDDALVFEIRFETRKVFQKFFVNVVVYDMTGVFVSHFRNDLSGIDIENFQPGLHHVELNVLKVPFRAGKYFYQLRLVGDSGGPLTIKDSEKIFFGVNGTRKSHNFVEHLWNIDGAVK